MARFDKYDPVGGGFRAPLNAAYTGAAAPIGVGLNGSGKAVPGSSSTGVVGIICQPKDKAAGDVVDVMTNGEITDITGLAAGTVYYVNGSTGALETSAPAAGVNKVKAGYTVEATRLIVRVETVQG